MILTLIRVVCGQKEAMETLRVLLKDRHDLSDLAFKIMEVITAGCAAGH